VSTDNDELLILNVKPKLTFIIIIIIINIVVVVDITSSNSKWVQAIQPCSVFMDVGR
jgi:hypothetical protein